MQQIPGVAVLVTQLELTDRRALSQAWYGTLHVAQRQARANPAPRTPHVVQGARVALSRARCPEPQAARGGSVARSAAASTAKPRGAAHPDPAIVTLSLSKGGELATSAAATDLAHKLERALARHLSHAAHASFALRIAEGRVHVVVRADGARTRMVVVCAPSLRERVERALAQARVTLAAHGRTCEVA